MDRVLLSLKNAVADSVAAKEEAEEVAKDGLIGSIVLPEKLKLLAAVECGNNRPSMLLLVDESNWLRKSVAGEFVA